MGLAVGLGVGFDVRVARFEAEGRGVALAVGVA
jgi:hypothetical protein